MRAIVVLAMLVGALRSAAAQSPELAIRELSSGQVKKGVRSIGFGGDGATWGNYSLVYRDAGTALFDIGVTGYDDGNTVSFTAVGVTTPQLWHGLAVYLIALSQHGDGLDMTLDSPGLGGRADVRGTASNEAMFAKIAMPLAHGFAAGVMLAYEISQFAGATPDGSAWVRYATEWRPSGGFGVTWQPDPRVLVGTRAILNHDWELRDDASGRSEGLARSYEGRLGASVAPWHGGLLDAGGTVLYRSNAIADTHKTALEPNLGIEQLVFSDRCGHRFVARTGLDESTFGAGVTVKLPPFNIDVAYLHDLGLARIGTLFGEHSNSVLVTMTLDYAALRH